MSTTDNSKDTTKSKFTLFLENKGSNIEVAKIGSLEITEVKVDVWACSLNKVNGLLNVIFVLSPETTAKMGHKILLTKLRWFSIQFLSFTDIGSLRKMYPHLSWDNMTTDQVLLFDNIEEYDEQITLSEDDSYYFNDVDSIASKTLMVNVLKKNIKSCTLISAIRWMACVIHVRTE